MSIWDDHPKAFNRAKELYELLGHSYNEVSLKLNEEFRTSLFTRGSVKGKIQRSHSAKEEITDVKSLVLKLIDKERTKSYICQLLQISTRILTATLEDLKDEGYLIDEFDDSVKLVKVVKSIEDNIHTIPWKGETILRFGAIGDTHIASKWQQLTHLNTFYDLCEREGIDTVYHSGDISEGVRMRQGHEHEIFLQGSDDQEEYIIEKYPKRNGIVTKFITGNHDHSSIKQSGHDIGKRIGEKRKDMIYLGTSNAKVFLAPNCVAEFNHPLDGASYALSYSMQKYIDSMTGGEKGNLLFNGHHHKAMYLPIYRNIHAFEVGCFEAQTPWMRGKRIAAHVGGWIIQVHVDEEGTITRCQGEFIPFYKMIVKDY